MAVVTLNRVKPVGPVLGRRRAKRMEGNPPAGGPSCRTGRSFTDCRGRARAVGQGVRQGNHCTAQRTACVEIAPPTAVWQAGRAVAGCRGQGVQGCEAGPTAIAAHGRLCTTCSWPWVEPDCRSAPVLHRLQRQGMQVVRQDQAARTAGAARYSSAGDAASLHDVKRWSRPTAGQGRTGAQPGAGCNGLLAGTEQVVLSVL